MTEFIADATLNLDGVSGFGNVAEDLEEQLSVAIEPSIATDIADGGSSGGIGTTSAGLADGLGDDLIDLLQDQNRLLSELVDTREQSLFDSARSGGDGGGGLPIPGAGRALTAGGGGSLASLAAPAALVGGPIAAGIGGLLDRGTAGGSESFQFRNFARGSEAADKSLLGQTDSSSEGIDPGQSLGDFTGEQFQKTLIGPLNSAISDLSKINLGSELQEGLLGKEGARIGKLIPKSISVESVPKTINASAALQSLPPQLGVEQFPETIAAGSGLTTLPAEIGATAGLTGIPNTVSAASGLSDIPTEIGATSALSNLPDTIGTSGSLQSIVSDVTGSDSDDGQDSGSQDIDGSDPTSFGVINNAGDGTADAQTAAERGMQTTARSSTADRGSVRIEDRRRIDVSAELDIENDIRRSVKDAVSEETLSEREIKEIARDAIASEIGR